MQELDKQQFEQYAQTFTDKINVGDWIFLNGDLGAGKTFFTQNMLKKLGTKEQVTSPTFPIMTNIKTSHTSIQNVCHLDLYRIKNWQEILYLGLEDSLEQNYVVIVEWANILSLEEWGKLFTQLQNIRPKRIIQIDIEVTNSNKRNVVCVEFLLDAVS